MTRVNATVDRGERAREKFQGGDQITYVIKKGDGDVTSRVALLEDVSCTDELDMMHYLQQTQRALNKVTAFFLPPRVETALYANIRSTLFLRQRQNRSLFAEEAERTRRFASLLGDELVSSSGTDRPKKRAMRQQTLIP